MKKLILLAILLLLGIFVGTSFALPVLPAGSIYDTYLHPNDNESGQRGLDVIGNAHYFQIFGHRWSGDSDSGNSKLEIYLSWNVRFAYTCGNDVHAPVPEPATMILFGTGLIGLAGFGRRKFKE